MAEIPKIRFKGFSEGWEERRLIEIMQRITRKNQDLESELPLTISSQYGLIDQNEFFDKRIASKDVRGYYLVRKGEFAYNKSTSNDAPWGAVKRLDRYEKGVLSTLYIVFGINDETKIDSDYIVAYYDTNLWHKGVQAIAAEGARNHGLLNITPADFFETTLTIPQDIKEQKRIGYFFKELNHLITLHQHKYDETKELKKYMLQKMFPKNGKKIPEIRFAGFTDDWEQRKLKDIINVCSGRDYKHLDKGVVPVYGTGGYMLSVSEALSDKKDAIGIGRKGTIDKPYILKAPFWTVDTLFYCIPTENCDLNFVFGVFQNINWKAMDESTGVPSLSKVAINNVDILVPTGVEQEKIGVYFSHLDHLITLHQRKCDELKEVKKFMLQNMFPQKG